MSNELYDKTYKLGKSVDPFRRADELQSTGVLTPFRLEFYIEVDDYTKAERMVHECFDKADARVAKNREFFKCELDDIRDYYEVIARILKGRMYFRKHVGGNDDDNGGADANADDDNNDVNNNNGNVNNSDNFTYLDYGSGDNITIGGVNNGNNDKNDTTHNKNKFTDNADNKHVLVNKVAANNYICEKCGEEFTANYILKRHLRRKRSCVQNIPDVIPDKMCKWCGNSFTHISSKYAHERNCPVKKNKNKLDEIRQNKEVQNQHDIQLHANQMLFDEIRKLTLRLQKMETKMDDIIEIQHKMERGGYIADRTIRDTQEHVRVMYANIGGEDSDSSSDYIDDDTSDDGDYGDYDDDDDNITSDDNDNIGK